MGQNAAGQIMNSLAIESWLTSQHTDKLGIFMASKRLHLSDETITRFMKGSFVD